MRGLLLELDPEPEDPWMPVLEIQGPEVDPVVTPEEQQLLAKLAFDELELPALLINQLHQLVIPVGAEQREQRERVLQTWRLIKLSASSMARVIRVEQAPEEVRAARLLLAGLMDLQMGEPPADEAEVWEEEEEEHDGIPR